MTKHLNINWGTPLALQGLKGLQPMNLMRFIDHSNGPRQAVGILVFKKPFRSGPSLVHENRSNLHFEPQLFGFRNIINNIARRGPAHHVCLPDQVWPLRSINAVEEEVLQMWHMLNAPK